IAEPSIALKALSHTNATFSHHDIAKFRKNHGVNVNRRTAILAKRALSPEQQRAAVEVTGQGDLKSLAGVAGSGKSTTLAAMREVWEAEGYTVKGAALA